MRKCYLLVVVLLASTLLNAQFDKHFSQFFNSPLTLNPAETGSFDGTFRATAIYRSQWTSVNSPYKTFSSSYDHKFDWGLAPDDYVSGGMMMYNDNAGDGNLNTTLVMLSGAYHKPFRESQKLTFGLQIGYWQQNYEEDELTFADQWDGSSFTNKATQENLQSQIQNKFDLNVGLRYENEIEDGIVANGGIAVRHLTFIKNSYLGNEDERLGLYYTANAGLDYDFNDKVTLSPKLYFAQQSRGLEISAGTEASYLLEREEFEGTLYAGVWYRIRDAVIPYVAVKYKDMKLGLSYDVNLSSLTPYSGGRGGFEISFQYIGIIEPAPVSIVVPCIRI